MATQTIQEPKYKICTTNCLAYKHPGDYGCEKGNFVFRPPLRRRCRFSLLEGEMEKGQASCTDEGGAIATMSTRRLHPRHLHTETTSDEMARYENASAKMIRDGLKRIR